MSQHYPTHLSTQGEKMNYRLMFTLNAIVAGIFGAAFLLFPQTLMRFFGVNDSVNVVAAILTARFFGGSLLVTAALLWFLQNGSEGLQKSEAAAMMVASIGGFVLTVMGMASLKVIRANGWIPLVIFVVLAAGYAYLVFGVSVSVSPSPSSAKTPSSAKKKK